MHGVQSESILIYGVDQFFESIVVDLDRLLISFEKALWVKFDLIQNLNATDMIEICRQLEHDDIWNDCLKTLCQGEQ